MATSKKIILKIVVDILIVFLISVPIILVEFDAVPTHKQGFFCNDQSLKHPFYKTSTVPDGLVIGYSFGIPMIVMLIVEVIDAKFNKNHITKKLTIGTWDVPSWLQNSYRHIGYFYFGNACAQITTVVLKYSAGRLRPHFFELCKPLIDCSAPGNIGRYITDYKCQGNEDTDNFLKEVRLSFPSGHSSFAGFALIYCALYLQVRMTWNGSAVFKHALQFLLILLTLYTGLSRVLDYMHHWTDVLAGLFLGISYAFLVAKFVSKLFDK